MSEDYVHVDQATQVVLENGWLTPVEVYEYIKAQSRVDAAFLKKMKALLSTIDWKQLKLECVIHRLESK